MLTSEKWKRLSRSYGAEQIRLWDKAADSGLTEEEQKRLDYITEALQRLFKRFLKHSRLTGEFRSGV